MRENVFISFTTRLMVSFLFMLSLYLLLHGHDYPGGGFIGGLVGASGVVSLYISRATSPGASARVRVGSNFWGHLMFLGISMALFSGMWGLLFGDAYLDAWWYKEPVPGIGKIGTPFIFDMGVYIAVIAVIISITRVLANVKNPDEIYEDSVE